MCNTYGAGEKVCVSVPKRERKMPPVRPSHRCEDIYETSLKQMNMRNVIGLVYLRGWSL
jgi:hypothetical protein